MDARRLRRAGERCRRVTALLAGLVTAAPSLVSVPVAVTAAVAAAGVTASAVATASRATAASGLPVLVVKVNGEANAPEAALLTSAGYTVTQVPATGTGGLSSMSQTTFNGYAAVVIGDPPSGGSCTPTSWQLDTAHLGSNWESWVTGNVAVLGTDAGLAASLATSGNTAAQTLITDTAEYAAAQPADTGSTPARTGLYLSLEDCYANAAQGTDVPVLDGVPNPGQAVISGAATTIGGAGGLRVNGGLSCADPGTVNNWEAAAASTFSGLTSASLTAGAPGWPSPGCAIQEGFDSWPAGFTPVAYDAATDASKDFTASNGTVGQPYVLLGAPVSTGTQALAPSTGGEVPAGATSGGTANPAAPGISQASAGDPVNTETGAFTQTSPGVSIPTFGPPLSFSATYDSGVAQQETQTGSPGAMGYGWMDNWASSLTAARPVAGNIYTLAGLRSADQNGVAPQTAPFGDPGGVAYYGSDWYFADSAGNRIVEVPHAATTQWGVSMTTAVKAYMVAGAGTPAGGTLNHPQGIAFDSSGDMYIADTWDSRIEEIPSTSKTQWGVSMTANHMYTVAGSATGANGHTGDGGAPTSALLSAPAMLTFDSTGDMYIADGGNNRVQEVPVNNSAPWVSGMTAGNIYTVAGNANGTAGISGDGGASRNAYLSNPTSVSTDSSGNVYIADSGNNRVQGMSYAGATLFGVTTAAHGIYTIAGSATGTAGNTGDTGTDTSSLLNGPQDAFVSGGNLYIADSLNNRIREIAGTGHTEWGVSMTANQIYEVAGTGTAGFSGDGSAATSAVMNNPLQVGLDGAGALFIADASNNRIRKVNATTYLMSTYAGNGLTVNTVGNGGPATQAALNDPLQEAFDSHGDTYIADTANNRIQEIAAYTHTQYGIAMTGGDVYTIAGQADGQAGCQCDGRPATQAFLAGPWGITIDGQGSLYIADTGNNRIQEVPNVTGTWWGQSMTAGDMYTIAGDQHGAAGSTGDGGPAASALLNFPNALTMDPAGDIYISDSYNSRVQEIAATSTTQWGQAMTAGDIYTIAGQQGGALGSAGDGGPATSASLYGVGGLALDAAGDLYIGDGGNNRVQELAATGHAQWGQSMTANDIYTVTGGASATLHADGGPASATIIAGAPSLAIDVSGDLYIADEQNNRIQEIANVTGTQWGQSMTAGDEYTVAGSPSSASGNSGDGGPATSALMANTTSISTDPEGDLYITDNNNGTVREVASATANAIAPAPGQASAYVIAPAGTAPGGLTVTQPGGARVTFWPQTGGTCTSPYVKSANGSGSYCVLPEDQAASLTYNSGPGTYTFRPAPGAATSTYSAATGLLASLSDIAGNTLTIAYNSPSPGGTVPGNGTCPTAAASCETITAAHPTGANGRALILGYNGTSDSGQITSVTDPMNRTWTYAYNTSTLQLTSATDPKGNTTSYTYGIGSGNSNPLLANDLLTVTDPNAQPGGPDAGDATVNVYNNAGQVITQTDPMGIVTTISYCANPAAGACMNSSTGTGVVTIASTGGTDSVDTYTQGVLTAETIWNGSTPSETDYGPALTAVGSTAGTLLNAWKASAEGNVTSFTYDSAEHLTSVSDPLSHMTMASTSLGEASCGADATAASPCSPSQTGPSPVAAGGVITPPSSAPPAGVSYTLYDTDGHPLYSTVAVYPPGSNTPSSVQTDYTLYAGNSITLNGANITCAATPPSPSLPCAQTDARGNVTQLTYDSAGDLTSQSTPDGNGSELAMVTYAYNADGEQTSSVSADGNLPGANAGNYTTVTAYDADGRKTSVTQAGGAGATVTPRTISYGYDANGNQTTVTDPLSHTTTTTYNADDGQVTATDPAGNTSLTCYDDNGNVAQTVPPAGVAANHLTAASCPTSYPSGYGQRLAADATTTTFDAAGHATSTTMPAPAGQSGYETTSTSYNADGLPVQVTSPPVSNGGPNQVTVSTYNGDDQLTAQTTGYGTSAAATVSYCYDPNGTQTAVVAADGNTGGVAPCNTNPSYPWTVDPVAYPAQAAYQTTSSYDSAGQLVSVTTPATAAAPSGGTTTFTYDTYGDLLTSTDPNGITTTTTYATPGGHVASVSYSGSSAHSVSYTYDAEGTTTGMTDATGTSSYTRDPFGELTSVTNGAGQTISYSHNADGESTGITYPLPGSHSWATTTTVNYGYDNAGQLTSVTDFNGHQITITPNADGAPTSVSLGSTGDTISYTYNAGNALSAIALQNSSSTLQSFTYTHAPDGEILSETDVPSSTSAAYAYDPQGRVASMTPGGGAALNYAFDAAGNLTTLPTGAVGTYDHDAELTSAAVSGTTTSYAYDADGQRLSAKQGSATIASGTWNGAGQLTSYSAPAADMTAATYAGSGLRASATTGSGTQSFTWNGSQLLLDSSNAYVYVGGTTPAEQVNLSTGAISYLSTDALGSVRGIISPTGTLTATTSYDAWGNPQTTGGLTSYTPFGYAGGYTDPTGLIYLINRYYDPGTGQFLSVDPAVSQTGQPYAYAGGNPVNATDPEGLWQDGIPSDQNPWSGEQSFKLGFVGPILGLGRYTSNEWKFQYSGYIDGGYLTSFRRIIDLYTSTGSHMGWLNELKVGRQYGSGIKGAFNIDEQWRDRTMMLDPYHACHPSGNYWGGTPCDREPLTGMNWWFRYKLPRTCQISPTAMMNGNLCPEYYLRKALLGGHPQINLVYVFYWPQGRKLYAPIYAKQKTALRNALESNACPVRPLDTLGLPQMKFMNQGLYQYFCTDSPSPVISW